MFASRTGHISYAMTRDAHLGDNAKQKATTAPRSIRLTIRGKFSMELNRKVADFTLQTDEDTSVSLSDYTGKPVVLFFYPRADTPGCTIEACGFRDAFTKFKKAGIVVLGISRDTVKDQKKFKDKY